MKKLLPCNSVSNQPNSVSACCSYTESSLCKHTLASEGCSQCEIQKQHELAAEKPCASEKQ